MIGAYCAQLSQSQMSRIGGRLIDTSGRRVLLAFSFPQPRLFWREIVLLCLSMRVPALFLNGVNSHFGTLCTTSRYSKEETMSALFLPSKIPCSASTQGRGNFGKESVMIGVVHLKNVNEPFSSGYVNT